MLSSTLCRGSRVQTSSYDYLLKHPLRNAYQNKKQFDKEISQLSRLLENPYHSLGLHRHKCESCKIYGNGILANETHFIS